MLQASAEPTPEPTNECVPVPTMTELVTNGGFEDGYLDYTSVAHDSEVIFGVDGRNNGSPRSGNFYFLICPAATFLNANDPFGELSQTLGSCAGVAPTCTLSFYLLNNPGDGVCFHLYARVSQAIRVDALMLQARQ